jgi:hypothetical protein
LILIEVATNNFNRHPWKGNVAFMIHADDWEGIPLNGTTFLDIDSTDFRDIVDFLSVCQGHEAKDVGPSFSSLRAKKLQVVRVYTGFKTGQARREPRFKEYAIPRDHPIVRTHGTAESLNNMLKITKYLGLPMFAVGPDKYLRWPPIQIYDVPQPQTLRWEMLILRQLLDPPDNRIDYTIDGEIDLWKVGYDNDTHISVVLFREDQKPLRWQDIDALFWFIWEKVIAATIKAGRNPNGKWEDTDHPMFWSNRAYEILGNFAWFEDFWHSREQKQLNAPYQLGCGANVPGYGRIPCPYHVRY